MSESRIEGVNAAQRTDSQILRSTTKIRIDKQTEIARSSNKAEFLGNSILL